MAEAFPSVSDREVAAASDAWLHDEIGNDDMETVLRLQPEASPDVTPTAAAYLVDATLGKRIQEQVSTALRRAFK